MNNTNDYITKTELNHILEKVRNEVITMVYSMNGGGVDRNTLDDISTLQTLSVEHQDEINDLHDRVDNVDDAVDNVNGSFTTLTSDVLILSQSQHTQFSEVSGSISSLETIQQQTKLQQQTNTANITTNTNDILLLSQSISQLQQR